MDKEFSDNSQHFDRVSNPLEPGVIGYTIRLLTQDMLNHYNWGARGETIERYKRDIQSWTEKGHFGDIETDITEYPNWNGRNSLHALLSYPHGEDAGLDKPLIKALLDRGAEILNVDEFGKLPSTTAYLSGNYMMAQGLMELEEQQALKLNIDIPEQSFPLREWFAQGLHLSHDEIRESFPELADKISYYPQSG